jgi:hypothetical protein
MSRMYFSTEDETVEVKGWERHWLGGLVNRVALGVFEPRHHIDDLADLVNPHHYAALGRVPSNLDQWVTTFSIALQQDSGDDSTAPRGTPLLLWRGKPISGWGLILNTAAVVGNDAIKLAARLHGQSEIHAWIDGPDRAWVADMIEQAVISGVYRSSLRQEGLTGMPGELGRTVDSDSGWENVMGFLRSSDAEPVVTHYSITDGFPNPDVAGFEDGWEAWEDLPADEQWHRGLEGLRSGAWSRRFTGLQIKPEDWQSFRFHHTLTAFDLYAQDRDARLDRALGTKAVKEAAT